MTEWRDANETYEAIAKRLNDMGHQSLAGKPFTATTVWRILRRKAGKKVSA
jgi:hypothetical protein